MRIKRRLAPLEEKITELEKQVLSLQNQLEEAGNNHDGVMDAYEDVRLEFAEYREWALSCVEILRQQNISAPAEPTIQFRGEEMEIL